MCVRSCVQIPAPYSGWIFGHYFRIDCKNCIVCFKIPKINEKEVGTCNQLGPGIQLQLCQDLLCQNAKRTHSVNTQLLRLLFSNSKRSIASTSLGARVVVGTMIAGSNHASNDVKGCKKLKLKYSTQIP